MSHTTLPILLVVQSGAASEHARLPGDLQRLRCEATDKALALGWLPIYPASLPGAALKADVLEESILQAASAVLVVGDHKSRDDRAAQRLLESAARRDLRVYGTHPTTSGYPPRYKLAPPPFLEWGKAAKRIRVSVHNAHTDTWHQQEQDSWACGTCDRFFGRGEQGERLARWCCVKQTPCDECGALTDKTWTHCSACREKRAVERFAKRERRPAGNGMVYSDRDDEWFRDMDEAESRADDTVNENLAESDLVAEEEGRAADLESDEERKRLHPGRVRAELEDMRLLTSEPVFASPFELGDHVTDDLPDDNDSALDDLFAHVKDEVDALNAKLESAPPLSYSATDYAVDLDAPDEGPSDS